MGGESNGQLNRLICLLCLVYCTLTIVLIQSILAISIVSTNVVATPKLAKIPHTLIENHSFPLVERTPTMRSSTLVAVSRALAMPLKIASTIWWRFEP